MIQLHFKAIKFQKTDNRNSLSIKKKYKIYFWLLKSPKLANSSISDFIYNFSNTYFNKRLDLLLFQTGFCCSVKQARFLVSVLQVFILNSIHYKKNLIVNSGTIIIVKEYFIETLINLIGCNIKLKNKYNKRLNWLKRNYYNNNNNISYSHQLENFNLNNPKVKRRYYYRQILLDSTNFNLIVL